MYVKNMISYRRIPIVLEWGNLVERGTELREKGLELREKGMGNGREEDESQSCCQDPLL